MFFKCVVSEGKFLGRTDVYRLYDEEGLFMRVVKRKEEAEYFVKFYGWTMKFFRVAKKEKETLKNMEEAPL